MLVGLYALSRALNLYERRVGLLLCNLPEKVSWADYFPGQNKFSTLISVDFVRSLACSFSRSFGCSVGQIVMYYNAFYLYTIEVTALYILLPSQRG